LRKKMSRVSHEILDIKKSPLPKGFMGGFLYFERSFIMMKKSKKNKATKEIRETELTL